MAKTKKLPARKQVKTEDTWDLASLFKSDDEWEKAFTAWEKQISRYEKFRGTLGDGPDALALVDLGVIRSVDVSRDQVRVEFTPTFLGCPALEVMRDAMAARISALGADAQIQVISDDSW